MSGTHGHEQADSLYHLRALKRGACTRVEATSDGETK